MGEYVYIVTGDISVQLKIFGVVCQEIANRIYKEC